MENTTLAPPPAGSPHGGPADTSASPSTSTSARPGSTGSPGTQGTRATTAPTAAAPARTATAAARTATAAARAAATVLRARPLTLLALLTAAAWITVAHADGDLRHVVAPSLAAAAALVTVAWAEARVGAVRTGTVAVVGSLGAAAAASLVLLVGSAVGEEFSQIADGDRVWGPSVTLIVVLVAVSRGLAPARRQGLRAAVLALALAGLLFGGHGIDLARALALLAGLPLGRALVPLSAHAPWHDEPSRRARTVAATALGTVALGWTIAAVARDAVGVLSPISELAGPEVTVVAVGVLALAVGLLLRGRRLGLVVAVGALVLMTGLLAWYFTVIPLADDWFTWSGLSSGEVEWQVLLLLIWVAPATATIVLLRRRRAFDRRTAADLRVADRDRVLAQLRRSDAGSLGFMATWAGNGHWFTDDGRGAVAYRVAHGVALTVSDPISAPDDAAETIRGFARHCSTRGLVPAFYSVHGRHLDVFAELGWSVTPVAEESVVELATFTTSGKKRQDLRTATNRAARDGVRAVWSTYRGLDEELRRQVDALSDDWVAAKALPEMGFTLGGLHELDDPEVRLLVAVDADGAVHGVTSWLPSWRDGRLVGRTLDVMRRGHDPMPGVVEFLIATAAQTFRAEGLETLSLSGTPLASADGTVPTTLVDRLVARLLATTGRVLEPSYGFTSLRRFKAKFDPAHETLWLACPSPADLAPVGRALATAYVPTLRARQVVAALRAARGAAADRRMRGAR
ncbi:phosphatidylglycerol lysyltransferase domain-containing protein [Frigoribacterium endophyticum]|uniref:phosphatidylglycerol lysyltransferase domain-containing protein n=1 Tax=Frigoribacterium endophyticum TaxID=1522176 RepID=UPI00141FBAA2|nr:lysylphosphatidylglycerol synthetase-like protein (DUF2156 family) [Frigoribacterium endophyticum]